jgi:hypothetical protein
MIAETAPDVWPQMPVLARPTEDVAHLAPVALGDRAQRAIALDPSDVHGLDL